MTLLPEWQQPKVPIYLLFPERRLMPRKLRTFIDFMVDEFEQNAYERKWTGHMGLGSAEGSA